MPDSNKSQPDQSFEMDNFSTLKGIEDHIERSVLDSEFSTLSIRTMEFSRTRSIAKFGFKRHTQVLDHKPEVHEASKPIWKLEPLSPRKKSMWRRYMEFLISVCDYIIEFIPAWQTFLDGSRQVVQIDNSFSCFDYKLLTFMMTSRPRIDIYIDLPKSWIVLASGRANLDDAIHRYIATLEQFSSGYLLDCLHLSSEQKALELVDQFEAAIYVWKQKIELKRLLSTLKLRFPELSQITLDTSKIQYNKMLDRILTSLLGWAS
ncbi:hypothetical protein AMTRI_Chr02g216660 [Amborella trichopoda]